MRIEIDNSNVNESLYSLALHCTTTGKFSISLYPDATEWINTNNTVPFVMIGAEMRWNIPIQEVAVYDLARTFFTDYDLTKESFEVNEIEYSPFYDLNVRRYNKCLIKYLRNDVKEWTVRFVKFDSRIIKAFLEKTTVSADLVFPAIWTRDSYSINEFMKLFSTTKHAAIQILNAAGYVSGMGENYYISANRKRKIEICLSKAKDAIREVDENIELRYKLKHGISYRICQIGSSIETLGQKIGYGASGVPVEDAEPAFGKRKDWIETFIIFILVVLMILVSGTVIFLFNTQLRTGRGYAEEYVFDFWSSIIGSFIGGIVTVITTWFIIKRSYKVDYHAERISNIPLFKVRIVYCYSMKDKPKDVLDFCRSHPCDYIGGETTDESMLIEIHNQGRGPAFNMEISGGWMEYDDGTCDSIMMGDSSYVVIPSYAKDSIHLTYYDMFGNYYSQDFVGKTSYETNVKYFAAEPPRLVLRTNRIRYRQ